MLPSDVVLRVENLSKCYQIYDTPADRLKQFILPRLQKLFGLKTKQYFKEFWALKGISLEVKKGQTLGIVGRNGSGKSTLLQMICGTLSPTDGSVKTNGRIAALLELGSGFNPDFTGHDNVYLNASLLGLTKKEIDARFEDIVSFADIGEFISQPVKTYSSGMMVRLAFAVITQVDADILVIDEALAVGDVYFVQKCMRFISNFKNKGGTVIFVSHDISSVVSISDNALLVTNGKSHYGLPQSICDMYLESYYDERARTSGYADNQKNIDNLIVSSFIESGETIENQIYLTEFNQNHRSFGLGGAEIVDVAFYQGGIKKEHIMGGGQVSLVVRLKVSQKIFNPVVGIILKDRLGQALFTDDTFRSFQAEKITLMPNNIILVTFDFSMPVLAVGDFSLDIAVAEGTNEDHVQHHWIYDALILKSIVSPVVHGKFGFLKTKKRLELLGS